MPSTRGSKRVKTSHPPSPSISTALSLPPQPSVDSDKMSLPSPNMSLTGHTSSVYSIAFAPPPLDASDSPPSLSMASGGYDGSILLWSLSPRSVQNYNVITSFKNAVTSLQYTSPSTLLASSADKSVSFIDSEACIRIRKYTHHTSVVNDVSHDPTTSSCYSVSDDRMLCGFDARCKGTTFKVKHEYQITAVAAGGGRVYTAGVDNVIRAWDARKLVGDDDDSPIFTLSGHTDTPTGLCIGGTTSSLLYSNAMDNTIRAWDISPYSSNPTRCTWVKEGVVKHDSEKRLLRISYNSNNTLTPGSSDGIVNVMDGESGDVLFKLPGHKGAVTDAKVFKGVLASAGVDRQVIIGEL
ncbi:hypothetical protein TrCOL_g10242 [Triparma columacea]|uniref:Uncharacterized protein n=1 Tax=Triparma columacea TaxID=722753 RepID=A0A9W7GEV4_9STRA|nr:hypothetical protein TrCOL_g10242 [Triparma columacea]